MPALFQMWLITILCANGTLLQEKTHPNKQLAYWMFSRASKSSDFRNGFCKNWVTPLIVPTACVVSSEILPPPPEIIKTGTPGSFSLSVSSRSTALVCPSQKSMMAAEKTETEVKLLRLSGGGLFGIYTVTTAATDDWITLSNFEVSSLIKPYVT